MKQFLQKKDSYCKNSSLESHLFVKKGMTMSIYPIRRYLHKKKESNIYPYLPTYIFGHLTSHSSFFTLYDNINIM
jgi:hypothetical protein